MPQLVTVISLVVEIIEVVIPGGRLVMEGGMPDELGTGGLTGTEGVDELEVGTDTEIEETGTDELGTTTEELGTTDEPGVGTETETEEYDIEDELGMGTETEIDE